MPSASSSTSSPVIFSRASRTPAFPSEMGLPEVKFQPIFPSVTILGGSSDRFYYRQWRIITLA